MDHCSSVNYLTISLLKTHGLCFDGKNIIEKCCIKRRFALCGRRNFVNEYILRIFLFILRGVCQFVSLFVVISEDLKWVSSPIPLVRYSVNKALGRNYARYEKNLEFYKIMLSWKCCRVFQDHLWRCLLFLHSGISSSYLV